MRTDPYLPTHAPSDDVLVTAQPKNNVLWQCYQQKKQDTPMLFPTEGALMLGVSELTLLLASPDSTYLGSDCTAILHELHTLGVVQHVVRNQFAVHEKQARFINLKIGETTGISMGADAFDLRFFIKKWQHALAIKSTQSNRPSYCIAFFDDYGQAISKVFLTSFEEPTLVAWHKIIEKYSMSIDTLRLTSIPEQPDWQPKMLDSTALTQFHDDWQNMTDIHQFHKILATYKIDRLSSYHQAPTGSASAVQPTVIERLFEQLKDTGIPIMIFVGNTGVVQIQADALHNIKRLGDWINILDNQETQFNLHLNDRAIAQVWQIKRPNSDGFTTAFEAFDKKGNSIVTFFGVRTEGQKQDPKWQMLADALAREFAATT